MGLIKTALIRRRIILTVSIIYPIQYAEIQQLTFLSENPGVFQYILQGRTCF